MAPTISKKRKIENVSKPKAQRPVKKFKKQALYNSSSSSTSADEASDFPAVDLADSASESAGENLSSDHDIDLDQKPLQLKKSPRKHASASSSSAASDSEASLSSASDVPSSSNPKRPKMSSRSKRNDPTAFATSISSILSSKLPTAKRSDPVLARSSSAQEANTAIREAQLEKRARAQIRAEKKQAVEKGRVKDVLLGLAVGEENEVKGDLEEGRAGRVMEEEKRLKKTAQRGVVKLFNAFRMAQVRGEEARKEAVKKGIAGDKRRKEAVGEMSKKGFLEMVASGGAGGGKNGKMKGDGIEEG
ncbi:MAG: hypothetical protein LQ350_003310 [Teloschistes chrysophthalmus]|nr:MAG: hypothetical protein LQ350_003310 [Niorma chrysophthalma]